MDRSTLALPGDQDALIEAVAAANRRTIVVAQHRRAGADAVAATTSTPCWRPGIRASSSAPRSPRVLFGDSDPGRPAAGHVPGERRAGPGAADAGPSATRASTAYERYDEGIFVGYRWYDQSASARCSRSATACPTRGSASTACACAPAAATTSSRRCACTNIGDRAGSTVAQAYVGFPRAAGEPPQQLKGYEKVRLRPGDSGAGDVPPRAPPPTSASSTRPRTASSSCRAATRWRSARRRGTFTSGRRST